MAYSISDDNDIIGDSSIDGRNLGGKMGRTVMSA